MKIVDKVVNSTAPRLTRKQTEFVKALSDPKKSRSGEEAAMIAYDVKNANVARSIASENLTKPNIRLAIDAALEKHGITTDAAIAPIGKALRATTKMYNHAGEVVEEVDDIDLQLRGSDRALKLMGVRPEEQGGNTFIIDKAIVGGEFVK